MKFLPVFLLFFCVFSFAQEANQSENDSVNLNRFELKLIQPKNHFEKIDLNVRIEHWDGETPEEIDRKKEKYRGMTYGQEVTSKIVGGIFEGIINGITSKK